MEKRNIAIIAVLMALVALVIIILSLIFTIDSNPSTDASIENIILPSYNAGDTTYKTPTINLYDSDKKDEDNDPVISGLPDKTLTFGESTTLDLDNYASDDEDSHSDLDFTITYTNSTSPASLVMSINSTTHILTITESNGAWEGTETVTIRVEDTDGNTDEDTFLVTINNGTTPTLASPVISGLPDIEFNEGGSYSLSLDNYVSDSDTADSALTWTYTGNTNVLVSINSATHIATFTATANWNGEEDITFRATDPEGNYDEDTMEVEVNEIPATPVISWLSLSDKTIQGIDPKGTVIYSNILSRLTQTVSAEDIQITLSGSISSLTLKLLNSNLILDSDIPIITTPYNKVRYTAPLSGTVTLTYTGSVFDCADRTESFNLNILACQEHCTFETCYWYCG